MADSEHDPHSAHVLGVGHDLDSESVPHLVAAAREHFFADLVAVDVVHNLLGVHVRELHWERLEDVALGNMAFHCLLELSVRNRHASHAL